MRVGIKNNVIIKRLFSPFLVLGLFCSTALSDNVPGNAEGVEVEAGGAGTTSAQETPAQRDARMAWWREAKFGMFIHWGVYAVPARGGEWIMHREQIPVARYKAFAKDFNPVKYDPTAWVKLARDAGMRYMVITSKHHDGFALYPSDVTDWDIADATPYKKDLLGPLMDAAHKQGLKLGFYYSHAQDWNHPGGAKPRHQAGGGWDPAQKGDFDTYLKTIAVPQVRELITRYQPDIFWWDTPIWMDPKRADPFFSLMKQRPGIITNNRLGGGFEGDTHTPEQIVPITGFKGDWETCMTIGDNWGYTKEDTHLKSTAELIVKLADICSKGGNFLLNVGPTSDGVIHEGFAERLLGVGKWLEANGASIYGTEAGPFQHLSWGCATLRGNLLYLHVFDWPKDGLLKVPLKNDAAGAWLLTAPSKKLTINRESDRLVIQVPSGAPDPVDSVVVLELNEKPAVQPLPTAGATARASAAQRGSEAKNVLDGTAQTRWRAPVDQKTAWLEIDLGKPMTISGLGMDEPDVWPRLNQTFTLAVPDGTAWRTVAEGHTNGHGVKQNITSVTAQIFRLTMTCGKGAPGIVEFQLYQPE